MATQEQADRASGATNPTGGIQYKRGPIERWSGKLLRWLMAYVFIFGSILLVVGLVSLDPLFFNGVLLVAPYLIIRYRDPDSTTLPLANAVRKYTRGTGE